MARKPSCFRLRQCNPDEWIPCGRPCSFEETIPVMLLHPVFGQFIDDCHTITVTCDEGQLVDCLADVMSELHDDEYTCSQRVTTIFGDYGLHIPTTRLNKYEVDGQMSINGNLYVIVEFKNEMGSTNSEAFCQAVSYYLEGTRTKVPQYSGSVLPCLLLILCG